MLQDPAFYYARSFSAFERPARAVYHKAPRYLVDSSVGSYYASSPFVLNYLKNKYQLGQLTAGSSLPSTMVDFLTAYRRYPKPVRHFAIPTVLASGWPVVHYYQPNSRATIYQSFLTYRVLHYFFYYRTFQIAVIPKVKTISTSANPPNN
jgi:hypothetical protein